MSFSKNTAVFRTIYLFLFIIPVILCSDDFHPLLAAVPGLPGVRVRLQQSAVTYLNQVASNILASQLPRLVIPDVVQKLAHNQGIIKISKMRISRFRRAEQHSITTSAPNRISWTMRNLDLGLIGDLSGDVNIVVPFNLTGQAEILAEGIHFHLESSIEKGANGSAHVTSLSCQTNIRVVHVFNHNGGLFGLAVNVFKEGVSDNVRQLLQGIICKKVRKYIDEDLNEKLSEAQTKSKLNEAIETHSIRATMLPTDNGKGINILNLIGENFTKDYQIDFRLKADPICRENTVDLASSGEISYNGLGGTPFGPMAMMWPIQKKNTKMLSLLVSDYLPNSLFYHTYKQGIMSFVLSSKTDGVSSFLQTTCEGSFCISDLVPQLSESYPNSTVEIALKATRAPAVLFTERDGGVISISISAMIIMYVLDKSIRKQIAVIDLEAVADAKLHIQGSKNISGKVHLSKFNLKNRFTSSNITNEELSDISILVSELLENMINGMLSNGFPLPIPRVLQLNDIEIQVLTRRLFITTDISVDERKLSEIAARTIFNGPQFGINMMPLHRQFFVAR